MTRRSALLAFALLVAGARVEGQDEPELRRCEARGEPVPETLARLTWHEGGVDALADASALHDAIGTMAGYHGISWTESACRYSRRLFHGRTTRAPWILALDLSGRAPSSWPAGASWEADGPRWLALVEHATAIDAGTVEPVCSVAPSDWGTADHPVDRARIRRGERRGWWYRVECPGTRNVYLRREHLDPDPD